MRRACVKCVTVNGTENANLALDEKEKVPKQHLPDIQLPLNRGGWGILRKMSSKVGFLPFTLGPSSGGETSTMLNTIRPRTAMITSNAMKIPRQFLSLGELETNS